MGGWFGPWCMIRRNRTCREDARFVGIPSVVQRRGRSFERDVIRVERSLIARPSDHEWNSGVESNVLVLVTSIVNADFFTSMCTDES
jgi:hypothetical protein